MQARVNRFQAKADRVDDGQTVFQDAFRRDVEGFEDGLLLVDRQSGEAMTITLWRNEQTRDDSLSVASEVLQRAADTMEGRPERQDYEVVEHRPGQNRRYARVSTGQVELSWFDQPDASTIIDAASQQPGYAGFLVLADRENSRIIGMSFWDNQEHLEASESGYYTQEMDKSRDQFVNQQWERRVYEVLAQR